MLKGMFERAGVLACAGVVILLGSDESFAQTQNWTLTSTVQRVLQQAPEKRVVEAEVKVREGARRQADVWPNPTVELGASNSLGKEDGKGGTDLTQLSIRQPLPLGGRLGAQRKRADASLRQSQAQLQQQALMLEYEAARVFHRLQLNNALLKLSQQRLETANEFQRIGRRREQAGDLSRLERLRLDVVRASANQLIASAEGEFSESLSDFQTLLNTAEASPELTALDKPPALLALAELESGLDAHPALTAARQGVEAAGYAVATARANRFADPEVWLAHEREFLGDRRQDVLAFGVAVTLPLWDRGKGNIDMAQASKLKAQFEVDALQRQLGNRLRLNHLHLAHLIAQSRDYRVKVLAPADEIFQLTRKGFAAGQVGILNLVDAVDIYFNARARYLELLQEAWLEAADLRRAAGLSMLASQSSNFKGTEQ